MSTQLVNRIVALTMSTALLLTVIGSASVYADGWRYGRDYGYSNYSRHGYNHGHRNNYYGSSHYSSYGGYRSNFNSRHYSPFYSGYYSRNYSPNYSSNYVNLSFGSSPSWRHSGYNRYGHGHRHYSSGDAGSFIGGLVVGGLISGSLNRDHYRGHSDVVRTRVVSSPRVTYRPATVSRTVISNRPVSSTRTRLLRDLQGQCFEISYAADGTEQRTQLADDACNF